MRRAPVFFVHSTLGDHDGLPSRDEKGGTDENGCVETDFYQAIMEHKETLIHIAYSYLRNR